MAFDCVDAGPGSIAMAGVSELHQAGQFAPAAIVTLLEDWELDGVRLPQGPDWHRLPIRDGDVPGRAFETRWTYSGARLRMQLRGGARILIHCRGGLGRTGTIAARLLVELGAAPAEAIAAVRRARAGAIENAAQEKHVLHCRPAHNDALLERRLACLLGGAVGDGFGFSVEFDRLPSIRSRYGPRGIREPELRDGLLPVSDDTQMTLFTLEGLARAATLDSIREAYLDWLGTQDGSLKRRRAGQLARQPVMNVQRGPGSTCLSALAAGGRGSIEQPINNSKGCGGVMRVAPIGLMTALEPAQAFRFAAGAAALTHGHPGGYLSAGALAGIIRLLLEGWDLRDAAREAAALLRAWPGHEETLALLERSLGAVKDVRELGEGWVGDEALAIAVYAALAGRDFPETLALAANHDGDSDSTAAIAGQIRGAWRGLDGIPHAWITVLDVLEPLLALVWKTFASRSSTASRSS